jgi:hypothetical protein
VGPVIAWLVVVGLSALLLWGAWALNARATASHPVMTAAVSALVAIPVLGLSIAWAVDDAGVAIEQNADVFATLAQLIATLLIAFAVEASGFKRIAETTDVERRELAAIVGGLGGGAGVGLAAALWGLVHPWPGLAFLFTAIVAIVVLVALLVARPVSLILRQRSVTAAD